MIEDGTLPFDNIVSIVGLTYDEVKAIAENK